MLHRGSLWCAVDDRLLTYFVDEYTVMNNKLKGSLLKKNNQWLFTAVLVFKTGIAVFLLDSWLLQYVI